jgi:hypothetical protein
MTQLVRYFDCYDRQGFWRCAVVAQTEREARKLFCAKFGVKTSRGFGFSSVVRSKAPDSAIRG